VWSVDLLAYLRVDILSRCGVDVLEMLSGGGRKTQGP
jgi:hypothetical protein